MSGDQPKAPARPSTEDGITTYNDTDGDGVLEVEPIEHGNIQFYAADESHSAVVTIHQRDRVALARQLLEGL